MSAVCEHGLTLCWDELNTEQRASLDQLHRFAYDAAYIRSGQDRDLAENFAAWVIRSHWNRAAGAFVTDPRTGAESIDFGVDRIHMHEAYNTWITGRVA